MLFVPVRFELARLLRVDEPVPLRSRLALSLPSMTFARGGGCSIHCVSSRDFGAVLTTGGCRSFTAGLRE